MSYEYFSIVDKISEANVSTEYIVCRLKEDPYVKFAAYPHPTKNCEFYFEFQDYYIDVSQIPDLKLVNILGWDGLKMSECPGYCTMLDTICKKEFHGGQFNPQTNWFAVPEFINTYVKQDRGLLQIPAGVQVGVLTISFDYLVKAIEEFYGRLSGETLLLKEFDKDVLLDLELEVPIESIDAINLFSVPTEYQEKDTVKLNRALQEMFDAPKPGQDIVDPTGQRYTVVRTVYTEDNGPIVLGVGYRGSEKVLGVARARDYGFKYDKRENLWIPTNYQTDTVWSWVKSTMKAAASGALALAGTVGSTMGMTAVYMSDWNKIPVEMRGKYPTGTFYNAIYPYVRYVEGQEPWTGGLRSWFSLRSWYNFEWIARPQLHTNFAQRYHYSRVNRKWFEQDKKWILLKGAVQIASTGIAGLLSYYMYTAPSNLDDLGTDRLRTCYVPSTDGEMALLLDMNHERWQHYDMRYDVTAWTFEDKYNFFRDYQVISERYEINAVREYVGEVLTKIFVPDGMVHVYPPKSKEIHVIHEFEGNEDNGVQQTLMDIARNTVIIAEDFGTALTTIGESTGQAISSIGEGTGDALKFVANAVSYSGSELVNLASESKDLVGETMSDISEGSREIYSRWYDTHAYVLDDASRRLAKGGQDIIEGAFDTVNYGVNKVFIEPTVSLNEEGSKFVRNVSVLTFCVSVIYVIVKFG